MKYIGVKLIRQTNAIISMEPHICDLNKDEMTHLDTFLKKTAQRCNKLMQLNYSCLKILKLKIYSSSLLGHLFLCPCYLITRFCYLKHSCIFSPFLSQRKLPNFCFLFLWKVPWTEQRSERASFCKLTKLLSE